MNKASPSSGTNPELLFSNIFVGVCLHEKKNRVNSTDKRSTNEFIYIKKNYILVLTESFY
jgi:hypothetical protein